MMDKRTLLAFGLIGLVFLAWSTFFAPQPTPRPKADTTATARVDTTGLTPPTPTPATQHTPALGGKYAGREQGASRFITIETPLYRAILNTQGGLLSRFELKNFKTWYGAPVQLINDSTGYGGELAISFKSRDGRQISTRNLYFDSDAPETIRLGENDSIVVTMRLPLKTVPTTPVSDTTAAPDTTAPAPAPAPGAAPQGVEKRFVFHGDSYGIGFDVSMQNMADEIGGGAYAIQWDKGLKYQEHNSVDESSKAQGLVEVGEDDVTHVEATEVGEMVTQQFQGPINWIGMKTKYFGTALIPTQPIAKGSASIQGMMVPADSSGQFRAYSFSLNVPYSQPTQTERFTLFMGPLSYDVAKSFGLEAMIDLGVEFIVRPIAEYFMLPLFRLLHSFIGNYGVVIIVFSMLIRLLLWPLSIPQIKSSRKMQLLQPKIAEMRERFKDDPQQQQMETMKVYREYGINPVSGCLPLLLQLPILYALWGTLSSAIDLRQAGFGLWINDLSIPDVILNLPFSLPLLGNTLSGLAILMGVTLFFQQKMMITDPKQKAMIYFMPVFLTLMFNHLPSGLNLYYFTFNLLAIVQQVYMTKFSKNTMTLDDMKREAAGKKKGWLAQKLAEAQKIAEMQQGRAPGAPQRSTAGGGGSKKVDGRTPVEPRKKK